MTQPPPIKKNLSSENISLDFMNEIGFDVNAVLIKPSGNMRDIIFNTTPALNKISEILNGRVKIIGAFPDINVVFLAPLTEDLPESSKIRNDCYFLNEFRLMDNDEDTEDEIIYGNILAVRMNEESQHENLFKAEIIEYIENTLKNRRSRRNSSDDDDAEKGEVYEEAQCGPGNNGPSPKRTRSGLRFGN